MHPVISVPAAPPVLEVLVDLLHLEVLVGLLHPAVLVALLHLVDLPVPVVLVVRVDIQCTSTTGIDNHNSMGIYSSGTYHKNISDYTYYNNYNCNS
jgi:hypothetical protein